MITSPGIGDAAPDFTADTTEGTIHFHEWLGGCAAQACRMRPQESPTEEIRARLRARIAEINEELRGYPGPIARCDSQLGGLLEERSKLQAELDALG